MEWINNNTKVPIANWAIGLEDGALAQAENLANLDFVVDHVALMPDCHQGMGMPIGGVIACKDVIIPNAVGVDIGCTDKDTEYLTHNGWVKISDYKNEEILVFDKDNYTSFFEIPLNYIKLPCDMFYHILSKYGVDQVLCENHKMLLQKGSHHREKRRGELYTISMKDFYKRNETLKLGERDKFIAIIPSINLNTEIKMSDDEIRVQIMLMADGYTVNKNTKYCRLRFKKKRKILRSQELLKKANISYSLNEDNNGITTIYFHNSSTEKRISYFWGASKSQINIICDEVLHWDGWMDGTVYFSKYKSDIDFVQYAFAINGKRSTINKDSRVNKEGYRLIISDNQSVGIAGINKDRNITIYKSVDKMKYCFTTTTGYWIMRRNGCICITGNCGMGFIETDVPVEQLRNVQVHGESLIKTILKTIKKVVPVGFAHHKKPQECLLLDNPTHDIMDIEVIADELEKARFQIGTLGGGNHFIELQSKLSGNDIHNRLDAVNGNVNNLCIMLHSGSRNFGYKIAKHFNTFAQALGGFEYRGDEGLAHFDVNSQFGKQYIRAMNFALDFAKENRRVMMEKIKNVVFNLIRKHVGSIGSVNLLSEVNIHHNYAALESHYGKDVWVQRKGAICMSEGVTGIIPGSMGTASYIVEGKGNKESFESASHGAGRTMGRMAFNRQYSLEKAEKSMEGVEHLGWSKDRKGRPDFSEAPAAYKDIEQVIRAQGDLIDIKMKLKPIGSVKV